MLYKGAGDGNISEHALFLFSHLRVPSRPIAAKASRSLQCLHPHLGYASLSGTRLARFGLVIYSQAI